MDISLCPFQMGHFLSQRVISPTVSISHRYIQWSFLLLCTGIFLDKEFVPFDNSFHFPLIKISALLIVYRGFCPQYAGLHPLNSWRLI